MQSRTSIVLNTLHAVQEFMTTNASALGNLNSSESRRALDDVESALSGHAASQVGARSGRRAAVARKRVLRNALLVKYLRPISAIAVAQLSHSPDFEAMKLPRTIRTTPELLAAAAAMGEAAQAHADTFVNAGMSPSFIAELAQAAEELKEGVASRDSAESSRKGATSALRQATRDAVKVVRQLDALIEPRLASNTALLSKWKATRRFTTHARSLPGVAAGSAASAPRPAAQLT